MRRPPHAVPPPMYYLLSTSYHTSKNLSSVDTADLTLFVWAGLFTSRTCNGRVPTPRFTPRWLLTTRISERCPPLSHNAIPRSTG
jgi:hypothetical protein